MSQLPIGTTAVRQFLFSAINAGINAAATALLPQVVAIPIIGTLYLTFVKWVVDNLILNPLLDEGVALAIALNYVEDREAFDKSFIAMAMLDKQGATDADREAGLKEAEKAMATFIRRGPLR